MTLLILRAFFRFPGPCPDGEQGSRPLANQTQKSCWMAGVWFHGFTCDREGEAVPCRASKPFLATQMHESAD
jgi:hypothetical protein